MRTYLQVREIDHPRGGKVQDLVFACNCGKEERLAEFYSTIRPLPACLNSINLHMLAQWMGKFNYEHSACPDQPPEGTVP